MSLTKIPNAWARMKAHNRYTNNAKDHVENDDWPSKVVLVTCPTCCVHYNSCQCIWRSDQTLGSANREAHVLSQDDGQEICKRICDGGRVEKDLYQSVTKPTALNVLLTIAKPQILMSAPPRRNFFRSQGSGFASPRSLFTESMMNMASRSLRKCQEVWALSGKSTNAQYAMIPRKTVRAPSIMKIHRHLLTSVDVYKKRCRIACC
jgi:hypothetical protein